MPQHLLCPGCRSPLVIRDHAPANLTCPRCLSPIRNPNPHAAPPVPAAVLNPTTHVARPQPLSYATPRPADEEATRDTRSTAYAVAAMAVVLVAGAWLEIQTGLHTLAMMLLGLLVFAGIVTYLYVNQQRQGLNPSLPQTAGFVLVKGCSAFVILFFGVIALLFGTCALIIGGGALFHR